ncbi:hypothetical protein SADUNF_Sadunf17G0134300 [Salix dunnii]|uniref:Uncharacterized protein n=1 Tax=Salix dunnii TaxID=1413687 RepID=A0A835J653_9ROSI|nr:hypothetical protein SADUNF_Sadunf17G0134300 [Salix dunnii]
MDIAQCIKQFFLSITTFLKVVWGRVLPSHSSNGSPAFDLESQSVEAPAQLQSQAPQSHSAMETELQSPPPAQQTPPLPSIHSK